MSARYTELYSPQSSALTSPLFSPSPKHTILDEDLAIGSSFRYKQRESLPSLPARKRASSDVGSRPLLVVTSDYTPPSSPAPDLILRSAYFDTLLRNSLVRPFKHDGMYRGMPTFNVNVEASVLDMLLPQLVYLDPPNASQPLGKASEIIRMHEMACQWEAEGALWDAEHRLVLLTSGHDVQPLTSLLEIYLCARELGNGRPRDACVRHLCRYWADAILDDPYGFAERIPTRDATQRKAIALELYRHVKAARSEQVVPGGSWW